MREKIDLDPIEQYVIDVVRKLRRTRGLRQKDIASILNTSPSFIGNVENCYNPAKYNLCHVKKIAAHFDISPRFFLPEQNLEKNKAKGILN